MTASLRSKRVAIYARYSSALQNEASIDDQVRRCRRFVVERGGSEVADADVYADAATSGASLQRARFMALMDGIRRNAYDVIVTEDVSRITRDIADGATLYRELQYLDVTLLGVADGTDTSTSNSKVAFTMHALMGDMLLEQLRDKTLRGLESRALAGMSTGGLPYGYTSRPVVDDLGKVSGHVVQVDAEQARIVRRMFQMYADGVSLEGIAQRLTAEGVPPPRAKSRHRRKGWIASTVREMLRNEKYTGRWSFKVKKWKKLPGTNTRRPRNRPDREVLRMTYQDRRIVNSELWDAVQSRLAEVRHKYTGKGGGGAPGRQNHYPFSGLLRCGECGAPMTIHAGTSAKYYRCGDSRKRGTCSNMLSVKESLVRERLLGAVREQLIRPEALDYLRQKISQVMGEANRSASRELVTVQERLARTEERIARLIGALAEGEPSDYLATAIRDLEAQAKSDRAVVAGLQAQGRRPISLPTREEIAAHALDLESAVEDDPLAAREALRRLFDGGIVVLQPQPAGHYIAEANLLPLVALMESKRPRGVPGPGALDPDLWPSNGCAGRI